MTPIQRYLSSNGRVPKIVETPPEEIRNLNVRVDILRAFNALKEDYDMSFAEILEQAEIAVNTPDVGDA